MIRIGICDDSSQDRERLVQFIGEFFGENNSQIELAEYDSGEKFFQGQNVDILFLDIEMAEMDGITIKDRLQKEQINTRIIFITSHVELMEEAFGKQVFGFLCKPVSYKKFKNKFEMVLQDIDEEYQVVLTGAVGESYIDTEQILYIKANGKYSDVELENHEALFSDKGIGTWAKELETRDFFLCHRSYLVNLYWVRKIENDIILLDGEKIPVSRRIKSNLKTAHREYIMRKAK